MMRKAIIGVLFIVCNAMAQTNIPQNYESNLSLYGNPKTIKEYYYHRLAQIRGHFYNHQLSYSPSGKVIKHVKSNESLYDTILPIFKSALPTVGTTIYSFTYDSANRLVYFENRFTDSSTQISTQRDESWIYDDYQMLIQRNFWEWSEGVKVIKNPSYQRTVLRDEQDRIIKIEKKSYSFLDRGLALSEITEYKYKENLIDSIIIYQKNDEGNMVLSEKRYDLVFTLYNHVNTDSLLLGSYTSLEKEGNTYANTLKYDDLYRQTLFDKKDASGTSVLKKEWVFEPYMNAMVLNESQRFETHYDASGATTYQENFTKYDDEWSSDEVPLEVIERTFADEKIILASTKLWDQDQPFYRKKADFEYVYDMPTWAKDEVFQDAIYPNPCQGFISVKNVEPLASLTLVANDGRYTPLPLGTTIPLTVASGLYVLKLELKDGSFQNIKLIVE